MKKLYSRLKPSQFRADFFKCLNRILIVFNREPAVDRLVQFVTIFAVNCGEGNGADGTFLEDFINYVLKLCEANEKAVRFRSSQIIALVLKELKQRTTVSLDKDLIIEIKEKNVITS